MKSQEADLVIHNAVIYTCDSAFSTGQAMAIRDGMIVEIGPEREIMNKYKSDKTVDAEGRAVMPGFFDAHGHLHEYARTIHGIDLTGTRSWHQVLERVKGLKERKAILGRGWDHTMWPDGKLPYAGDLDALYPDVPVLLKRVGGHIGVANQAAWELLGEPRSEDGIVREEQMEKLSLILDALVSQEMAPLLLDAQRKLLSMGITAMSDAGITHEELVRYRRMEKNGELLITVDAMLLPEPDNLSFAVENGLQEGPMLRVGGFKAIVDGALGSHTACLREPYSDSLHWHGILRLQPGELHELAEFCKETDYQLNAHCIGDSALRVYTRTVESLLREYNVRRWRVEHAQVVDLQGLELMKTYQLIASVQPRHAVSDGDWAPSRLGERMSGAYAYHTLWDTLGWVAMGTDFPVESPDPIDNFSSATFRRGKDGMPLEGYQLGEALTAQQTMMAMTYWPAYAAFLDKRQGSLEPGKQADFIILNADPLRITKDNVQDLQVLSTYVKGKRAYSAE